MLNIFSFLISLILRQCVAQSQWLVPFSNLPRRFTSSDIALPPGSKLNARARHGKMGLSTSGCTVCLIIANSL